MISQSLKDYYVNELREISKVIAEDLTRDGAKDFATYRHLTGVISGLARAERIFLDTVEAADKEEDRE